MESKVALITGGNRGIGLEIARQLASLRYTVVVGARDGKAEQAALHLAADGLAVTGHPLDVDDDRSVADFVAAAERVGPPAVLVNNAGIHPEAHDGTFFDSPLETWRRTFETNLFGALRMCLQVVPGMVKRRNGRVVNIGSGLGQLDRMAGGRPAYRASKVALTAMTRVLAADLAGSGVLVNAMTPGWVRTQIGGPDAPRTPAEGADTAVWLCTLPDDGPNGLFFRDRAIAPW
ncbi:MAG TPA: SDR family NAD(P)-dependent oxidoreductase [Candidatus Limnocylindrales bacterium]|nr:SDR family NAD(P)-dependent oxidoreductase [Candidatus Limnocylindrales bacterium]